MKRHWPAAIGAIAATALAVMASPGLLSSAFGQPSGPPVEEQVAIDNEFAYVTQLTFPPGAASGPHSSLDPELGIVVEGELTLVTPAGREILGPGTCRWLPGLTVHDARNEGTRPVRMWVIIFKK